MLLHNTVSRWFALAWSWCRLRLSPPNTLAIHKIALALDGDRGLRWRIVFVLDWISSKNHYGLWSQQRLRWYMWSMLLPQALMKPRFHVDFMQSVLLLTEALVISSGFAAPGDHFGVIVLCSHLRLYWGPSSVLPLRAMSESVLMFLVHVTTEEHVDVYSLCCSPRPCWCSRSRLPLRALFGSMATLQSEAVFEVCAITRNWCGGWWCVLQLTVKTKEATFPWYWWL